MDSVQVPTGDKFIVNWGLQQSSSNALSYTFSDLTTPAPSSWSWDFGDGTTSTLQNPVHTFASGGSHTVTLVTNTACGVDSLQRTFTSIGIEEGEDAGWVAYPNPTTGQLTLQAPARFSGAVQMTLLSPLGEELELHHYPEAGTHFLSLEHLPAGVYTLVLVNNGVQVKTKVVKL